MTNGRGMMKFSRGFMRFGRGLPIVPAAVRAENPFGISTHTLSSSFLGNMFWCAPPPPRAPEWQHSRDLPSASAGRPGIHPRWIASKSVMPEKRRRMTSPGVNSMSIAVCTSCGTRECNVFDVKGWTREVREVDMEYQGAWNAGMLLKRLQF